MANEEKRKTIDGKGFGQGKRVRDRALIYVCIQTRAIMQASLKALSIA